MGEAVSGIQRISVCIVGDDGIPRESTLNLQGLNTIQAGALQSIVSSAIALKSAIKMANKEGRGA